MRTTRAWLLPVQLTMLAVLTACQSIPSVRTADNPANQPLTPAVDEKSMEDFVATDLISALMQLPEHDPWRTTIQINQANTAFEVAVEQALRNGNFGVQIVSSDLGNNYLTSTVSSVESNNGTFKRYQLILGGISIERDYITVENSPYPQSLIRIGGMQPVKIALYPDLFVQQGGNDVTFPSGVMFRNERGEWVPQNEQYITINISAGSDDTNQFSHERFLVLAKTQAYFSKRQSRSVDIRRWKPISQVKLVFPNTDTDYMGVHNKRAVGELLRSFNPDSHGFSITGCQNKTLLWDGTQSDSLDRQLRVRRELFAAGISPDVVQENGCFPSEFSSLLTRNAVIVTLHRKPI